MLLVACGPQDPCPHPQGLALDLKPGPVPASWVLVDPAAAREAPPLEGAVLALGAGPEDGSVAAGWLTGKDGLQLFALTLDRGTCVVQSWTAPVTQAGAEARRLVAMADGGLLVAGKAPGPGIGNDEAWVARYDSTGQTLWSVVEGEFLYVSGLFQTPSRESVTALALLPDGNIAAAGTADVNAALYSNWVLLLDQAGKVRQRIDLPRDDPRTLGELSAVVQQDDGSLLLAGTLAPDTDAADAWVLAVGRDTTLLWDRRYRAPGRQRVAAAAALGDDLVMVGRQRSGEAPGDAWITIVDPEGEATATASLRGEAPPSDTDPDESLTALAADGDRLLAAGGSGAAGGAWLLRLTPQGTPLDSRVLPGGGLLSAVLRRNQGLALAGGRLGAAGPPLLLLMAPAAQP